MRGDCGGVEHREYYTVDDCRLDHPTYKVDPIIKKQ